MSTIKNDLRIIICATERTSSATEACLRTLRYYEDPALKVTIFGPWTARNWLISLAEDAGASVFWTGCGWSHEEALYKAYVEVKESHLLLLDNDVTFQGSGVVEELRDILGTDPTNYAAGVDGPILSEWVTTPDIKMFGESTYLSAERFPIHCTMIRRSAPMDTAVAEFGFGCGMRRRPDGVCVYSDTGGLLLSAMRVAGYREVYVESRARVHHWGAMSRISGRHDNYEGLFREIIFDHPWKKSI